MAPLLRASPPKRGRREGEGEIPGRFSHPLKIRMLSVFKGEGRGADIEERGKGFPRPAHLWGDAIPDIPGIHGFGP